VSPLLTLIFLCLLPRLGDKTSQALSRVDPPHFFSLITSSFVVFDLDVSFPSPFISSQFFFPLPSKSACSAPRTLHPPGFAGPLVPGSGVPPVFFFLKMGSVPVAFFFHSKLLMTLTARPRGPWEKGGGLGVSPDSDRFFPIFFCPRLARICFFLPAWPRLARDLLLKRTPTLTFLRGLVFEATLGFLWSAFTPPHA